MACSMVLKENLSLVLACRVTSRVGRTAATLDCLVIRYQISTPARIIKKKQETPPATRMSLACSDRRGRLVRGRADCEGVSARATVSTVSELARLSQGASS